MDTCLYMCTLFQLEKKRYAEELPSHAEYQSLLAKYVVFLGVW